MGHQRSAERVTDSALEREIEAALAVEPSPEFVARVRTRIANEPAPAGWWHVHWRVAAAAVIVVATLLSLRQTPPERVKAGRASDVTLRASAPAPVVSLPPRVGETRRRSAARASAGSAARALSGLREPEVIISRDEQRAFGMLLAAIREGRIRALPQERAADASLEPADIAITPLVIEPLPQPSRLEGETQ